MKRTREIFDVITLFIYLHCDVIRHLLVQTWFVYFSLRVQALFSNFDLKDYSLRILIVEVSGDSTLEKLRRWASISNLLLLLEKKSNVGD